MSMAGTPFDSWPLFTSCSFSTCTECRSLVRQRGNRSLVVWKSARKDKHRERGEELIWIKKRSAAFACDCLKPNRTPLLCLPEMAQRKPFIGDSHANANQQRSFFSQLGQGAD